MDTGQFEDLHAIYEEKKKIVRALKEGGIAVLNIDNTFLNHLAKERGRKNTLTFGQAGGAIFKATRVSQSIEGIKFILEVAPSFHKDDETEDKNVRYEVFSSVLGKQHIYAILPALICGKLLKMSWEEAIIALERYQLPPGRMNIIPAVNEATILDSSYNSSPAALKESLHVLKEIGQGKRKVAVLGNMNDLGKEAKALHEVIGEIVPECADLLLTVGGNAKYIGTSAEKHGMDKKNIFNFKNANEAADFFKKKIKKDDIVLVKGSQNNVRLEKFVKKLMAHPEDAKKLLVRQEKVWQLKI